MKSYMNNEKIRTRVVAIYGRVSTEHDAQLAALENQMQWYDDQVKLHPNWTIVKKYIDEGITGTQAKKRPAFLKMIEDAKKGMFDLIITREVCRFARNTVDTLVATRELKNLGVEVYFVEDNIWTMDGDGELRLTIMATLAQEESRKISERVKAGQKISRDNGVLYGTGNILGYNRINGTYVIDEDQADTVKIIYSLYLQGYGEKKLCNELCKLHRKDSFGNVKWSASKINRILRNATYKGYMCYMKSYSNNFLEQKRINILEDDKHMYVKGDFPAIISEADWDKCQEIRKSRVLVVNTDKNHCMKRGKKDTKDIWMRKLKCNCGSSFRKNKWRTNNNGDVVFGYQCYNQVNNGSKAFREKNGLDVEGYCDIRMIGDWKLEVMAKNIIESVWTNRKEAVFEAYQMVKECYQEDTTDNKKVINDLKEKIKRLEDKIDGIIDMRAENEISKDEYNRIRNKLDKQIELIQSELDSYKEIKEVKEDIEDKLKVIKKVLDECIDFSVPKLSDVIIDKLVAHIEVVDNRYFKWYINFEDVYIDEMVCRVEGRKNSKHEIFYKDSEDNASKGELFTYPGTLPHRRR